METLDIFSLLMFELLSNWLLLVTWRSLDSIALESGTNLKSVTVDDADSLSTNIRVRRLFPEVWLFNSTTAGLVFAFTLCLFSIRSPEIVFMSYLAVAFNFKKKDDFSIILLLNDFLNC